MTKGRVEMLSYFGHEAVIALCERRIDLPRRVCRNEKGSRKRASPDFVGPPWFPFRPDDLSDSTRPENHRAPANERKRPGSPSLPRICAAFTVPTPGTDRKMSSESRRSSHHLDALFELFDLVREREASLNRDVNGEFAIVKIIAPECNRLVGSATSCTGVRIDPSAIVSVGA